MEKEIVSGLIGGGVGAAAAWLLKPEAKLKFFATSVSVPIGVNNSFGSRTVVIDCRKFGCKQLVLEGLSDYRSGTFASGETVTVRHICVYDDGSEDYTDRNYTTAGTTAYSAAGLSAEYYAFRNPSKTPVAFVVQAKTNKKTTSVKLTVYAMGMML
jgi:hypothetical protein